MADETGAGWVIEAGFAESPAGPCAIAVAPRGIVRVAFPPGRDREAFAGLIAGSWPNAKIRWNNSFAAKMAERIFGPHDHGCGPLKVFVAGTDFQMRVWRALIQIPPGTVVGYGELARRIGVPGASRAVGNAVGANPVAFLIPCHRVVRAGGDIGKYRWGAARKRAIIEWEAARTPLRRDDLPGIAR